MKSESQNLRLCTHICVPGGPWIESSITSMVPTTTKLLRVRLDHIVTLDGISLASILSVRNLRITSDPDLSF